MDHNSNSDHLKRPTAIEHVEADNTLSDLLCVEPHLVYIWVNSWLSLNYEGNNLVS